MRRATPTLTIYRGHHDVKPVNILVLSNGSESPADWQFKFADFGLRDSRERALGDGEASADEVHASTYGT